MNSDEEQELLREARDIASVDAQSAISYNFYLLFRDVETLVRSYRIETIPHYQRDIVRRAAITFVRENNERLAEENQNAGF